ncbi:alpha-amylase family glycosyl hydrolase [Mycoplasma sp. OR1901]|uniref:alpha-amylase family glycosyl hydrolase n=1 Tax=Mycoplasma sp. OR1901 TaxID=2742195 RepID=UPI0015819916|nr:alpha-amylase family glycosyl hydrolase [Mycoplasma sp. OR1901]QKT05697.1 alpha-amylase [Mycoplasma sp. OR1901]
MNLRNKTSKFYANFDKKYSYGKDDLGVLFKKDLIQVKIWQPIAENVELLIFDKSKKDKIVKTLNGTKEEVVWKFELPLEYEDYLYQFKITHEDKSVTYALDPYAYSLASFNWEGEETKVGKGVLLDLNSEKNGKKPKKLIWRKNNHVDTSIYELHVRDFTSSLNQKDFKSRLGTFDALREHKLFDYVKDLGITHVQLLPIQSAYTVNDKETKIYKKGEGQGWTTNYNWGYDPHNYFSINGVYSSNADDPHARIKELKELVADAHSKGVGVIMDVVYNHMMTNNIYDNILPGYYYRDDAKIKPVIYPPLADERFMVRKIILDSLKYFVKYFNIDGFRFDLSSFHHYETIDYIAQELRKINPNIVLHGEAWPFSDLKFSDSYIKGARSNNIAFGYFNDSVRDAIKGDEHIEFKGGLISRYDVTSFRRYVTSVVGGIKDFNFGKASYSREKYVLYSDDIATNLAYAACHDGMTLWDKINTTTTNLSFIERIEAYRQALMMTTFTQGRQFILAGTELLQSKPCDYSGEEGFKCKVSEYDDFNENPDRASYHPNSYKTTDYVNAIKWEHLEKDGVKEFVYDFFKKINTFRNKTKFFRLATNKEVKDSVKFTKTDAKKGILSFTVTQNDEKIEVIHNFSNQEIKYKLNEGDKVLFNSRIKSTKGILDKNSSVLLRRA